MKLTEHFTLDEMTQSQEALRKGLDNTPSQAVIENLKMTAYHMEKVRELLGKPIFISSGYRSPAVNVAVGGSLKSHHCQGYAVDFKCNSFGTPLDICRKIMASDLKYDQLIYEGTWVHISFAPSMRRENLHAHFKNGKASYTALN